jgi:hypothetical protein
MEYPGFIGPSYISQSPLADQEWTMNFYVEQIQSQGGSTRAALYPTPGFEQFGDTVLGAPGRAHFAQDGREWAVIGTRFYEISQFGLMTDRGTVAVDSNPATISSNGLGNSELFITSGSNGYTFNITTTAFTQIANLNGLATMGDFIDGYFLALDAASSRVYISDLEDGLTWDPTQFFSRSIGADPWVSMKVANRYIYLFGEQTSESWYDDGGFPIPFTPHPSGLIQYGCAAAFSPETIGSGVAWLAQTINGFAGVMRIVGLTPEKISNYALENTMSAYTLSDAIGDTYTDLGHTFYILTFSNSNVTWVYDLDTNSWCQRGTWIEEEGRYDAQHALFHAYAYGEHRMLDRDSGRVFKMASDIGLDVDDRVIRRVRRGPTIMQENFRLFYSTFELDMEVGLATLSGAGSDPQVVLRYSNDGGKTWSSELFRTAGATGEYGTLVLWNRLGMARKRIFEVSFSDPVPWRILNAYVEMSPSADVRNEPKAA